MARSNLNNNSIKSVFLRAATGAREINEMAPWLRAPAALWEDLGLTPYSVVPGDPMPPSGLHRYCMVGVLMCRQNTHAHKIKGFKPL